MNKFSILLMTLPLVGVIGIGKVQAQITSADTVTNVKDASNNNGGTTSTITGGNISNNGNGTNQFHSLTQFNLGTDDIANFQAKDGITNILTRVTGGNVSKINGNIQVTGGNNPNLFLMNPAGFIFGNGATLNLPGSLTVTTANSIEFGSPSFNATGDNNYGNLTGNPTAFDFNTDNIGAIINSGKLSVKEGQNLTLVGGTVVNTGTLAAKNGQINIAAVPGENTVRISQQGNLLSLDIPRIVGNSNTLPNLLVGGNIDNVTGITVDNGTVTLTGSSISIKDGDAVLSAQDNIKVNGIFGGNVSIISQNGNIKTDGISSTEKVFLSAQDNIKVNGVFGENVSIISQNGNIKTDRIRSTEKVFLSAEKGNIEVDTIFAGLPEGFERPGSRDFVDRRAGDINIKAGGFFRAIRTREKHEDIGIAESPFVENPNEGQFFASITVANTVLGNNARREPFISIKTKNDVITQNEPGDGMAEVKIEVGSEFFEVGNGSFKKNQSGTIGAIAAQTSIDTSTAKVVSDITFGKADPPPIIKPPPSEKPGDSNTDGTNTDGKNARNLDNGNQEQQKDRDQNRDRDRNQNQKQEEITVFDVLSLDESQNQEQEEITVSGVLSLDESLVALLKDKGHASELTLSNDGNGELTGSDFNLFYTDDEEELKTFNFDRDLLYKNYVFSRK